MGWFESLYAHFGYDGHGSNTILEQEDYPKAIEILENQIGKIEATKLLKEFNGIQNILFEDLSLSGFPHKDIPKGKERLEYIRLISEIISDSEVPFGYAAPSTSFNYFLGANFKQFAEFAKEVHNQSKGRLLNDHIDYENIVHPCLYGLIEFYGVKKPQTPFDLGGIDSKGILYIPNCSPKEFVTSINNRLKKNSKILSGIL